jgi:hypothetical protein
MLQAAVRLVATARCSLSAASMQRSPASLYAPVATMWWPQQLTIRRHQQLPSIKLLEVITAHPNTCLSPHVCATCEQRTQSCMPRRSGLTLLLLTPCIRALHAACSASRHATTSSTCTKLARLCEFPRICAVAATQAVCNARRGQGEWRSSRVRRAGTAGQGSGSDVSPWLCSIP